jgi:ATP-dependent Clp protease ATP-binding subunit ClpA
MDNQGTVLDFSNSIFIFTSNVGLHELTGRTRLGFEGEELTYENSRDEVTEAFKKEFAPEFINRIDEIVYFNQLSKTDIEKIVRLNLKKLPIKITKRLVSHIVDKAYSTEYGARNIKRFIKQNVTLKLADKILEGNLSKEYKPVFGKNSLEVEGLN